MSKTKNNSIFDRSSSKKLNYLDEEVGLEEHEKAYEKAQPSFKFALLLRCIEWFPAVFFAAYAFILFDDLLQASEKYKNIIVFSFAIFIAYIWQWIFDNKIKPHLMDYYQRKQK